MRNLLQRGMRDQAATACRALRPAPAVATAAAQPTRQVQPLVSDGRHQEAARRSAGDGTRHHRPPARRGGGAASDASPQGGPQDGARRMAASNRAVRRVSAAGGAIVATCAQARPGRRVRRPERGPQAGSRGRRQRAVRRDAEEHREPQEELPLSNLPQDVPGAVKELQNYEFMDPEAQHKFTELMEMLKSAMTGPSSRTCTTRSPTCRRKTWPA